jgi:hypothetical protein
MQQWRESHRSRRTCYDTLLPRYQICKATWLVFMACTWQCYVHLIPVLGLCRELDHALDWVEKEGAPAVAKVFLAGLPTGTAAGVLLRIAG